MSGPSILDHEHRMHSGMTAHVTRVLKGTHNSSWSGTLAYKTGIDLMVSIHCPKCCCRWGRTIGCANPVIGPFRVDYRKEDPDAWWRQVRELEAQHLSSALHTW